MMATDDLFTGDRLTIVRTVSKQLVSLLWKGECDFPSPAETLGPTLHGLISELRDRKLVMDFSGLRFMNSSSVTPILGFVKAACSKGIPVHLIYSSRMSWQRTMASSMRALVHALKHLSVELQTSDAVHRDSD